MTKSRKLTCLERRTGTQICRRRNVPTGKVRPFARQFPPKGHILGPIIGELRRRDPTRPVGQHGIDDRLQLAPPARRRRPLVHDSGEAGAPAMRHMLAFVPTAVVRIADRIRAHRLMG